MGTLKLIKTSAALLLIASCSDKIKNEDDQNFKYIDIVNYPEKGESAKLIMYEKNAKFEKKIKEYSDFSLNFFTPQNTNEKALKLTLNFDNSQPMDYDMELVIDNQYYYRFQNIIVKKDTFEKKNISRNDLYIYKTIKAKINDSTMIFDKYEPYSEKSIDLPFQLAKKL